MSPPKIITLPTLDRKCPTRAYLFETQSSSESSPVVIIAIGTGVPARAYLPFARCAAFSLSSSSLTDSSPCEQAGSAPPMVWRYWLSTTATAESRFLTMCVSLIIRRGRQLWSKGRKRQYLRSGPKTCAPHFVLSESSTREE